MNACQRDSVILALGLLLVLTGCQAATGPGAGSNSAAATAIDPLAPNSGDFLDVDLAELSKQANQAAQAGRYRIAAAAYLNLLRYDATTGNGGNDIFSTNSATIGMATALTNVAGSFFMGTCTGNVTITENILSTTDTSSDGTTFNGTFTFTGSTGVDHVRFTNPIFKKAVTLTTGDGDDQFSIDGGTAYGLFTVQTGAGNDQMHIDITGDTLFKGAAAFKTADGDDSVEVGSDFFNHRATFQSTVTFASSTGTDTIHYKTAANVFTFAPTITGFESLL